MRQKTGAKLLSLAMSVILAVGLMPLPAFAVWPEEATGGGDATGENSATSTGEELGLQAVDTDLLTATPLDVQASTIDYVDAKGNAKKANSAVKFTSSSALGESSAWYYVEGSVSKTDIWVSPDRPYNTINLILCDGAKLTTNGIEIAKGKTLRIWCQKGQTGKLQTNKYGIRVKSGGTVEINGGVIRADTWEDGQAGIGGKDSEGAGTITINSGDVKAWGADEAAGIGCGSHGAWNGTITINGGKVYAAADEDGGAGIGGGSGNNSGGGTITINGGEVEAIGSSSGAGIGSGYDKSTCGDITISGGTVVATGGLLGSGAGAGIGSGNSYSSCGDITIGAGIVKVVATRGNSNAESIGEGVGGTCGTVTIADEASPRVTQN